MSEVLSLIDAGPSRTLGLKVGSTQVEPGTYFPRAGELSRRKKDIMRIAVAKVEVAAEKKLTDQDAQEPPELNLPPGASTDKTYLVVSLDIDAPYPSATVFSPILHWIQSGLTVNTSTGQLTSSDPTVASYIGPAPPPLSSPHRYIFVLYEEPAGFDAAARAPADGKPFPTWPRVRFGTDDWAKEAGLGEALAVNYFVSN